MKSLWRCLRADFQKTKRTAIRKAHVWIPAGAAVVFLAYYSFSPWSAYGKVEGYYQVLGISFPFLIGLFCAIMAQQELEAGRFQGILVVQRKVWFIYSKLILLLLLGAGAVVLASLLFAVGFEGWLHQHPVGMGFYREAAWLLLGSNVPLYLFHLFLAFRFNQGVSIGLGIIESLIAALFLTGLGERIWMYVPPAWAARMVTEWLAARSLERMAGEEFYRAAWICAGVTLAGVVLLGIWYGRWEGRTGED